MKKYINNLDEVISSIILFFMLVLGFINVISRYVFHASISYTDELSTNLFVFISLIGAAIAAKRGSHLGLDLLDRFSNKVKKYFYATANLWGFVFCVIVFYYGIFMAKHEFDIGQLSPALRVPEWIYGSFVPIGAGVIALRFLIKAKNIFTEREGRN